MVLYSRNHVEVHRQRQRLATFDCTSSMGEDEGNLSNTDDEPKKPTVMNTVACFERIKVKNRPNYLSLSIFKAGE